MEEKDEKRLIDAISVGTPEPDFSKVEKKVGFMMPKRRTRVWIPVFSAVLALAVSIPVTWFLTREAVEREIEWSQKVGSGTTNDVMKYLVDNFSKYYETSIGSLISNDVIYADFYFGYGLKSDSQDENEYIVVARHGAVISSFSVFQDGNYVWDSSLALSFRVAPSDSFNWLFKVKDSDGQSQEIGHAFDLEPYSNSVR